MSTRHTCCSFNSNLNCHCEFSPFFFFFFFGHKSQPHSDWRGRRCSPNEYWQLYVLNSNSINLYIFSLSLSQFPNGNGTQNSLHSRCSHLFVCQTKATLNFFLLVNYTRPLCCASFVLIGWMWIYVTRRNCSCFSLPLHRRRSERITLGIWFGQMTCRSFCPHFDCDHTEPDIEILQKSIPHLTVFVLSCRKSKFVK